MESPWYLRRRFARMALAVLLGAIVVEGIVAICFRFNDFACHLGWGQGFLEGDPYKHGGKHYPPGRMLWNAGLAALGVPIARTFAYAAAIGAWVAILRIWRRIVGGEYSTRVHFAAGALTFGLLYPYVIRDLDDCGLQVLLLLVLTLAAGALHAGRPAMGAFWLALATTYKVTPLLFWPLLVWKRQWRAAAWMPVFLVLLNFTPAPFVGWETTWHAQQSFLTCITKSSTVTNPTDNRLEAPRVQNQSLQSALARLVQTYPPGHRLHLDHCLFVQLLDLNDIAAHRTVLGALLAFAAFLAWRLRRPWRPGMNPAEFASDILAVTILCAIVSPLCWLQHLVLIVPAVWWTLLQVLDDHAAGRRPPRTAVAALAFIGVVVLLLQRDVVGRELSLVVLSYKLDTLVALTALALVLRFGRVRRAPGDLRDSWLFHSAVAQTHQPRRLGRLATTGAAPTSGASKPV